jgi:hypothetical protein
VSNKIRIAAQKEYFDNHPRVLIVPVMDLETIKSWNGEGYKAVVMVGCSPTTVASLADICGAIRLRDVRRTGCRAPRG